MKYENVYFSGMDLRHDVHGENTPKFENAEALSYPDNSFDYAVMCAAIHHTSLPNKVITELYRVSKKGFLVIEAKDSFLMRIAGKLGLTEGYEVAGNFKAHGVNGTDIPNFIFRWTEREVEKTIFSFAPHVTHRFQYRYYSNYPDGHGFGVMDRILCKLLKPVYHLFVLLLPKQQNSMAFYVRKPSVPEDLKPWLYFDKENNEIKVDRDWIKTKYSKKLSR